MKNYQEQLKSGLRREIQTLEELEASYHYLESIAREIMCRAQAKLVEIEQEKIQIMRNAEDLDCIREPNRLYQQPFLFADDD